MGLIFHTKFGKRIESEDFVSLIGCIDVIQIGIDEFLKEQVMKHISDDCKIPNWIIEDDQVYVKMSTL